MRLIGLTGGIATGKSTFARALRDLGVPVIDADRLSREAVAAGTPALAEVARLFGPEVVGPDGELDRRQVAARVFGDAAARARLEAVIHPAVREAMRRETERLAGAGHDLAFYDVPLLYEVGLDRELEAVAVVWAPREAQLERMAARDGFSRAEGEARLAAQLPIDEKAARADLLVRNDGAPADLAAKARALLADLRAGAGRRLPNAPPRRY
ncbi:MAG: dephospho-CoA kinase [Deltaproteobacteria bacterium]|nr:dephospho-CoA kinase [Deltaproteobacteria bacterium]